MMTGPERRTAIINQIKTSSAPVPGKALAAQYEVSRQVIVQDIALIRAAGVFRSWETFVIRSTLS